MLDISTIIALKGKRKFTMLTAYDYPTAKRLSSAGIDLLLVGDSLGMVVLGYKDTKQVKLEEMLSHTAAVVRGNQGSFVVADLPFESCFSFEKALVASGKLINEAGADAVKIEGDPELVKRLVVKGIPVMGHTGLKPQTALKYGLKGKGKKEAEAIFEEALALEKAGVFAVVLECIPSLLAQNITKSIAIPTIGIGAGADCDGQVLVLHDMVGFFDDFSPRFARKYADIGDTIEKACRQFQKDVKNGNFPSDKESF